MLRALLVFVFLGFSPVQSTAQGDAKVFGCEEGEWIFKVNFWSLGKFPEAFRKEAEVYTKNERPNTRESFARDFDSKLRGGADRGEFGRSDGSFTVRIRMGDVVMDARSEEGIAWFRFKKITGNIVVTFPSIPDSDLISPPDDGRGKRITFLEGEWANNPTPKDCKMNTHILTK